MNEIETIEIDRSALVEFHANHFRQQLDESVNKGELTFAEAAAIHYKFIGSDALQKVVDSDVQRLTAWAKGQVH